MWGHSGHAMHAARPPASAASTQGSLARACRTHTCRPATAQRRCIAVRLHRARLQRRCATLLGRPGGLRLRVHALSCCGTPHGHAQQHQLPYLLACAHLCILGRPLPLAPPRRADAAARQLQHSRPAGRSVPQAGASFRTIRQLATAVHARTRSQICDRSSQLTSLLPAMAPALMKSAASHKAVQCTTRRPVMQRVSEFCAAAAAASLLAVSPS